MEDDPSDGPYLAAAFLCEKVLKEADGVVSAIRIIDRTTINVGPEAPETMPPIPIQTRALIILKSGIIRGSYELKIKVANPAGKETHIVTLPVLLEGDERGVNFDLHLNFIVPEQGLYWFGVYLQDQLLTKIPLRVLYQRIALGSGPPTL